MRGYAELGVPHIMFQCVPFNEQALRRLTEALQLYRDGNGSPAPFLSVRHSPAAAANRR